MNRVANKNGMIARRATPVAVATRYWRSQPFAGATACCHSRTHRFAHHVMAAVLLRCQEAQRRERPFLSATLRAHGFAGGLRRAAASRYCAAAVCGSSRLQPPPAP